MKIGGLQKFTLVDYPEKLAATVFFAGCSFRCPWCHNPELVVPEKIREQPCLEPEQVFSFLKKRKGELEGVVLTGGEPTIYAEIPSFCSRIKKMGYQVKLDTNGCNPSLLKELARENLVDYVAMDIKAPPQKYSQLAGLPSFFGDVDGGRKEFWRERMLANIEQSIRFLKKCGLDYEFRTTVVPGLLSKQDVVGLAKWLAPAQKFVLQEFRPQGRKVKKGFQPAKKTEPHFITEIYKAVDPLFENCFLRRA